MYAFDEIKKADSEIADAIQAEMERQNSHLELIASENWVSKAVMAAMGSPLSGQTLLWWMSVCGCSGRSCKRKSKEVIWL